MKIVRVAGLLVILLLVAFTLAEKTEESVDSSDSVTKEDKSENREAETLSSGKIDGEEEENKDEKPENSDNDNEDDNDKPKDNDDDDADNDDNKDDYNDDEDDDDGGIVKDEEDEKKVAVLSTTTIVVEEDDLVNSTIPAKDIWERTLVIEVLAKPEKCTKKTTANDVITIHVYGKEKDSGVVFDNTRDLNMPFSFEFQKEVLPLGLFYGISGMCEKEIRRLHIPAPLAFTDISRIRKGATFVEAGVAIIYEVELVDAQPRPDSLVMYDKMIESLKDDPDMDLTNGIPIEMLQTVFSYQMKAEARKKQFTVDMDDDVIGLVEDALEVADLNNDGFLNREEFGNSVLFKQDKLQEFQRKRLKLREEKTRKSKKQTKLADDDKEELAKIMNDKKSDKKVKKDSKKSKISDEL